MKKPTLFYNLLEWINSSMKDYLGLVLISRAFYFTDKLEKRVKSRLTAKSITLVRPQG
jgi:Cdc6-like AAA superfamily ATPase